MLLTPILLLLWLGDLSTPDGISGVAADHSQAASSTTEDTPTVAFCEMVKHMQLYFDKIVRVTATFHQATEGQYLSGESCPPGPDDWIGVGYVDVDEKQQSARDQAVHKIALEYRYQEATVTIVGILRNQKSTFPFTHYLHRFDIIRFEDVSPRAVLYKGTLRAGAFYQATVRGDGSAGLSLVPPLRIAAHHVVRIEWTNLGEFPALQQLRENSTEQQIIFNVLSDVTRQVTTSRWSRTVKCKIIR
jgi:hypothetical protein